MCPVSLKSYVCSVLSAASTAAHVLTDSGRLTGVYDLVLHFLTSSFIKKCDSTRMKMLRMSWDGLGRADHMSFSFLRSKQQVTFPRHSRNRGEADFLSEHQSRNKSGEGQWDVQQVRRQVLCHSSTRWPSNELITHPLSLSLHDLGRLVFQCITHAKHSTYVLAQDPRLQCCCIVKTRTANTAVMVACC